MTIKSQQWTRNRIRRLVRSGALHPMALLRETIIERRRNHPVWKDQPYQPFPWPRSAPTLTDLVAAAMQDERLLNRREDTYWRMYDQVWEVVFGVRFSDFKERIKA